MKQPATLILWIAASACLGLAIATLGQGGPGTPSKPAAVAKAAADRDADKIAFFEKEVLPILRTKCFECHGGGEKVQGQFRLTSREGLLKGGELGPAVSLEKPDESQL